MMIDLLMVIDLIQDIFITTSVDYDKKSEEAYTFFKIVQNTLCCIKKDCCRNYI